MLVFYSGWGYWEYDCIAPFDGERMQNRVDRGPLLEVCCVFELPENGKKEFKYNGEATVSYLLECKRSDGEGIEFKDYYYQPAEDDEPRFVLCEEQTDEYKRPIPRTVKFTKCIQENQTDSDASKDQTESLNDSSGVSDQQEINTHQQSKQANRRKRGQTQINIFLTGLCQNKDIDSLNAESLVRAIKPLVGTANCPVEKHHGFFDEVCVDWKPGRGSPKGSWGKKSFQNFVATFKKNNS